MRKLLIKLHLYGGLLCVPYLVIFATSSLNFNHRFGFMQEGGAETQWERPVMAKRLEDKRQMADAIRDSLDLMGWPLFWTFKEEGDVFEFDMQHFGKKYHVAQDFAAHQAAITEKDRGFWASFNALHFLSEKVPNAPWWVNAWQYYQDFCVVFLVFSIITGIYLWSKRPNERMVGTALIAFFVVFSLFLINYLWLAA